MIFAFKEIVVAKKTQSHFNLNYSLKQYLKLQLNNAFESF
jgi:hypothetical protein